MFYIKLDGDSKEQIITVKEPVYRGENLSGKIIYLVPLRFADIDIETAFIYLTYIRADGVADIVVLDRMEEMYNESYFQYTFPISCKFTRFPGEVCTWLQVFAGTPSNPQLAKTNELVIQVQDAKNMDDYLCDHQISVLYQIHKALTDEIGAVGDRVTEVENTKADNIIFNEEDSTIQLTANGEPIGDRIYVSVSTGKLIKDMIISSNGNLIVIYDDDSVENLGHVVGKDGVVYIPHVDEHKVLTFTIGDKPEGVPDPVDLNPSDEWGDMGDEGVRTDYVWESM